MITGLSAIYADYDAIISDVWGVVHNGVTAHAAACDALEAFRAETGGPVVLLTNAPRPNGPIQIQLDGFGVQRSAYDQIVTSGDATLAYLKNAGYERLIHIGPPRDHTLFEDLDGQFSDDADGEVVVCTGLYDDENETPEDYANRFAPLIERDVPLVCANPDLVVERGYKLVYCAGALAEIYSKMGGRTQIIGKPHAPVYTLARRHIDATAGRTVEPGRILAIGDGLPTDIRGAVNQGLDALFVTAGIHAAEFGDTEAPEAERIAETLDKEGLAVTAALPRLKW